MNASVLHLVATKLRSNAPCPDTVQCLELLLARAKGGEVNGLAFVAYLSGRGYIADTAGEATENPTFARGALLALDDKLSEQVRATRRK